MSSYGITVHAPDDHDYHADRQHRRVQAALKSLDPGDVLAIIDSRIAQEPDPRAHPLFGLVQFCLHRQVAVDGAVFWETWKRLVLSAIDTAIDEHLEREG